MPTPFHQKILIKLGSVLEQYVTRKQMGALYGSVDVYISEVTVLQPDLCFLSQQRAHVNDGKKFTATPDLVVEILSPSTEERDRTFKFREYAQYGAQEYWLVSPEKREIEVYKNSEKGFQLVKKFVSADVLNSSLFPDIQLNVQEIFN